MLPAKSRPKPVMLHFQSLVRRCHWAVWFAAAFAAGALSPASARALSCGPGLSIVLSEPVVTVVDGPGDGAAEQERWSSLDYLYVRNDSGSELGNLTATFGSVTFDLARVP